MKKKKFLILLVVLISGLVFFDSKKLQKVTVRSNVYLHGLQSKSERYVIQNNVIKSGFSSILKKNFLSDFAVSNEEKMEYSCDSQSDYIGTGCSIQIIADASEEVNYPLIVYGDVNGDGKSTITDMVQIAKDVRKGNGFSDQLFKMAADVDQDDSISITDAIALATYTLNNKNIPIRLSDEATKANIKLSATSVSLEKNTSTKIVATVDREGVTIIHWESKNPKIATVDDNGVITGLNGGKTKIIVTTSDGNVAMVSVKVTVIVPVTGISLNKNEVILSVNEVKNLVATITPSDASDKNLTWASSDSTIVSVSSSGQLLGIQPGNAVITVLAKNGIKAQCHVRVVQPVTGVSLNKKSGELDVGESMSLISTISPSNATNQKVNWKSSNSNIATVDANGKIKALTSGTAVITVTTEDGGYQASFKLKVYNGYTVLINPSHQVSNETESKNSLFDTEKKSMYQLANVVKTNFINSGFRVYVSPSSGSIVSGDGCFDSSEGDAWSTCGHRQVNWLIGKSNSAKTVYVALHSNASNGSTIGPFVLYYQDSSTSYKLANQFCRKLFSLYNAKGITPTFSVDYCLSSGNHMEPYYYYSNSLENGAGKGEAVLIEVGFHDNYKNQKFIEDNMSDIGDALVKAVKAYYSIK